MVLPLPDAASIDEFNRTLQLTGEDVQQLRTMVFRCGALYRKGSWVAGLGLLHCHTMLGEREAAHHLAGEFWGRRSFLAPDLKLALAVLSSSLGLYGNALALLADMPGPALSDREPDSMIAFEAFFVQWSNDMVEAARTWDEGTLRIIHAVEAEGFLPHMAARQEAVNAILLPVQCGCLCAITSDGDDQVRLVRLVYVAGDYAERRALSDQVSETVTRWCQQRGIDEGAARMLLSEVILPVEARPAVDMETVERDYERP